MRKLEKRSECPISYSLDLLGDKWTMLILRDIALNDKHFFKDFMEAGEGVATNVLSDRLKMLEAQGIVRSKKYAPKKTMKYYALDEKGIELIPILIELWTWGAKNDPQTVVKPETVTKRLGRKAEIIEAVQVAARAAW
ncbi:MAG: helix-turn-helix domain-containing protein [Bacteroidota bacterium]